MGMSVNGALGWVIALVDVIGATFCAMVTAAFAFVERRDTIDYIAIPLFGLLAVVLFYQGIRAA